jgi:hypothetical protein
MTGGVARPGAFGGQRTNAGVRKTRRSLSPLSDASRRSLRSDSCAGQHTRVSRTTRPRGCLPRTRGMPTRSASGTARRGTRWECPPGGTSRRAGRDNGLGRPNPFCDRSRVLEAHIFVLYAKGAFSYERRGSYRAWRTLFRVCSGGTRLGVNPAPRLNQSRSPLSRPDGGVLAGHAPHDQPAPLAQGTPRASFDATDEGFSR